jgi:intracellular septation protein
MRALIEFFPVLLFFGVYKFYDIYIATGVLIAATLVQMLLFWRIYRKIESMQWITLLLIVVFGGATLYLKDEQFIKWKLTIIECLFGSAFLVTQFIGEKTFIERMFGAQLELPAVLWKRLNLSWALFFYSIGALNIYVIGHFSTDDWVSFKTFGVPGLMIIFTVIQMAFIYKHIPENHE